MTKYFKFIEAGLIANPEFLEDPKKWTRPNPEWFSKLKEAENVNGKRPSLKKIDRIIRKHYRDCDIINEWIAARDASSALSTAPKRF